MWVGQVREGDETWLGGVERLALLTHTTCLLCKMRNTVSCPTGFALCLCEHSALF